jgi:DNA-binding response OmpR family regulator
MKNILIIDDSELYRDFLGQKLAGYGFTVTQAVNGFDGIMKLRQASYDLVIMDFYLSRNSSIEVLESKAKNPNLRAAPVIMASAKIDRENLLQVTQLGVRKFFTKPLKIDAMVKAIAELLQVNIEVDSTPCVIDANINDEILFVEVARGLNRDKIELLKFRLQELKGLYKVAQPKVLVLMSGLEVGPNDSLQLSSLLTTIADHSGARPRNIKILTASAFIRDFIRNRPAFAGVEVAESLEQAMDGLLAAKGETPEDGYGFSPDSFLNKAASAPASSGFNLHFDEEVKATEETFNLKSLAGSVRIAIVDDDFVLREIVKKAFGDTGIAITAFSDGQDFIDNPGHGDFDLVFLDLMMPKMDGFQVLTQLKARSIDLPVIVLSALSKRETVVKAMGLGVKSYLIKPIQPDSILRKAIDTLRTNF